MLALSAETLLVAVRINKAIVELLPITWQGVFMVFLPAPEERDPFALHMAQTE
jgi:hypothetical protein